MAASTTRSAAISGRSRLARLKRRADFLRVAAARRRAVRPGLILQAAARPEPTDPNAAFRVGFTASRKVGNAVTRNRAKRRLRAVAAALLPGRGSPATDYVLIARAATVERPYPALLGDLDEALDRVEQTTAPRRLAAREEK